jgi:hypothetical protein
MNPAKAIKKWLHDIVTRHTARCCEINRMVSESLEHKLPWRKRIEIRVHFLVCVWCVRYSKQLNFLRDTTPRYADRIKSNPLPLEAKQRIKRALQGQGGH